MPSNSLHALDLISKAVTLHSVSTAVVFGTDWFLKHHALKKIILNSGIDEASINYRDGNEASWRDLHDDLASRSLFDNEGARIAVVSNADKFVTAHRNQLERWVEQPNAGALLILDLDSFPATTKLYKEVDNRGLIVKCSPPLKPRSKSLVDDSAIEAWVIAWGEKQHGVRLKSAQAHLMVERTGSVFGMLDCELAKLGLFAGSDRSVEDSIVRDLVGGWRTKTVWEIADQIADGKIESAVDQLNKLFSSGQSAVGISAQLSWYFRRFGLAAFAIEQSERNGQRPNLRDCLEKAGFYSYTLGEAETRLRRIGRPRAKKLLLWLKALDLKLKGSHSSEPRARFALEEFVLRFL